MLLIDSAPQLGKKAQQFTAMVRTYAPVIYEGLLKPLPQDEAIYMAMSRTIQQFRNVTPEVKRLMHLYVSRLLSDDHTKPVGLSDLHAIRIEMALLAERGHYRKLHPFRTRKQVAA